VSGYKSRLADTCIPSEVAQLVSQRLAMADDAAFAQTGFTPPAILHEDVVTVLNTVSALEKEASLPMPAPGDGLFQQVADMSGVDTGVVKRILSAYRTTLAEGQSQTNPSANPTTDRTKTSSASAENATGPSVGGGGRDVVLTPARRWTILGLILIAIAGAVYAGNQAGKKGR